MKKRICFSVVICTRNRIACLKKCLISILKQSLPPKEIIIVDDGSENLNVYEFLENEIKKLSYRLICNYNSIDVISIRNKHNSGIVASRNSGIKATTGDVIAFLDDDGYAHKHWLKNLEKNYYKDEIIGIGGPVVETGRMIKTPTKKIKMLAYVRNGKVTANYRIKTIKDSKFLPRKTVPFLQGGNMSFRRNALLSIKGGDTNIKGNCYREETDLCLKISKLGKLLFEPSAITYHKTAMKGGSRDVIKFNLDKFLYYMYRNTTYFFFKHFNFQKAFRFTWKSCSRQIHLIRKNKTGLTRGYLRILNKKKSLISVILGTASGFLTWTIYRLTNAKKDVIAHSRLKSIDCFKLILTGTSIEIIKLEDKTQLFRKLFGL